MHRYLKATLSFNLFIEICLAESNITLSKVPMDMFHKEYILPHVMYLCRLSNKYLFELYARDVQHYWISYICM